MESRSFALDEQAIAWVLPFGQVCQYQDGEMIHARGDDSPGLSIVLTGQVKVGNYGADGKYLITRIMLRGETFGEFTLFANLPRTHNAEAFGDAEVLQLSAKEYEYLCDAHPRFERMLMSLLAVKLHTSLELLDDITRLSLPVRLGKLLLYLASERNTCDLCITQGELAEMLGVTVLSSHKALKTLAKQNLITPSYGMLTINKVRSLTDWVEEQSALNKLVDL
ncbi:MAG: Crp/Fnr family transcriptional regulator [Thalassotalea sp.]|nr:Crp/Fnr family transcriptional regulator [Thalassotalea sp.]